jgi:hypothetical protein
MQTTTEQGQAVAKTILEQLGAAVRMELAVKQSLSLTEQRGGIVMHLVGCRATSGKRVKIVLTDEDLYDIEVSKLNKRTFDLKVLGEARGVGCEQLRETALRLAFGE